MNKKMLLLLCILINLPTPTMNAMMQRRASKSALAKEAAALREMPETPERNSNLLVKLTALRDMHKQSDSIYGELQREINELSRTPEQELNELTATMWQLLQRKAALEKLLKPEDANPFYKPTTAEQEAQRAPEHVQMRDAQTSPLPLPTTRNACTSPHANYAEAATQTIGNYNILGGMIIVENAFGPDRQPTQSPDHESERLSAGKPTHTRTGSTASTDMGILSLNDGTDDEGDLIT